MKTNFTIEKSFPVSKQELYNAWLDSSTHSEMTGGEANCSDKKGESFNAWDGYITGENVDLTPNKRIVQNWRTSEFSEDDDDSRIEILFEESGDETKMIINHTNIPPSQPDYKKGWIEHYFNPMTDYFKS